MFFVDQHGLQRLPFLPCLGGNLIQNPFAHGTGQWRPFQCRKLFLISAAGKGACHEVNEVAVGCAVYRVAPVFAGGLINRAVVSVRRRKAQWLLGFR